MELCLKNTLASSFRALRQAQCKLPEAISYGICCLQLVNEIVSPWRHGAASSGFRRCRASTLLATLAPGASAGVTKNYFEMTCKFSSHLTLLDSNRTLVVE